MNIDSRWKAGVSAALLTVVLSLGGCAFTGDRFPELQQQIQSASTKADHERLAEHYEEEARVLQAKAAEHEKRALAYGPPTAYARIENDFALHCRYLATRYREAAIENLALAKMHRALASQAVQ